MRDIAAVASNMRAVEGYEDDVVMGADGGDEELVILDPNHVS